MIQELHHLRDLCQYLQQLQTDHLLVVTEKKVRSLYQDFFHSLQTTAPKSLQVTLWEGPVGEELKGFSHLQECLEFFLQGPPSPHRRSLLVAIGGGAVTDFGGLVASLLLRGIEWISVPTTFLGMIDAGLGGKVAINSAHGKNLIGHFHFPRNVLLVQEFLGTLSSIEWRNGAGEMIKYLLLDDQLEVSDPELLLKAARLKMSIVDQDPYERGDKRKVLNFGHSFGHAFEKLLTPKGYGHGECVLLGIEMILGLFPPQEPIDLEFFCSHYSWPLCRRLRAVYGGLQVEEKQELLHFLQNDKKRTGRSELELILLAKRGAPYGQRVSFDEITTRIQTWDPDM